MMNWKYGLMRAILVQNSGGFKQLITPNNLWKLTRQFATPAF
jgi:hypothetical protein